MIKIQKKQLFKSPHFLSVVVFIPLVIFFSYATYIDHSFFIFLIISLFSILIMLVTSRFRLIKKTAELDLQKQDYVEKTNLLQVEIEKERQLISAFHKKILNYSQLKSLAEKLNTCFSLSDTSKTLSEEINILYGHKDITFILYLFYSKTGELGILSSQKGQMEVNLKAKKGDFYDQWVVKNMKPLLVEDVRTDFRFDVDKIAAEESRAVLSLISIPLIEDNRVIGLLRLDSVKEKYFVAEDLRFLTTIGDLAAVAIENAQLYERIETLAIRDSLTGHFVRRHFLERLSQEMGRHLRRHQDLSFLMIDLDHFKKYNDTFGHIAGDIVLKTVGMILAETFHAPGDFVCRYGGEEFSILISDCAKDRAVTLANDVRKKIASQAIILRRKKTRITVSVGVATFPHDAQLKEELIQKADMALYQAKQKGRNRVCVA